MAGGTFPTSLPTYTITAGAEAANGAGGGTGLSGLLNAFEVDITALGAKLGTGASTPTAGKVLRSASTGTSVWGQVVMASDMAAFSSADIAGVVSDETGTGKLVFGTSPTLTTPVIGDFSTSQHDHSNTAGGGAISQVGLPTGVAVQVAQSETGALATGTTIIPFDNTIPQNTEGDQYMTCTITPKSSTNILIIEVCANIGMPSVIQNVAAALFQDSTANALATANTGLDATAGGGRLMNFSHKMLAGTTSATTFKVRIGVQVSGTLTFNGIGAGAFFGGTYASSITITEYKG